MGADPKALLLNFLQYNENMVDVQTCEAEKNINTTFITVCVAVSNSCKLIQGTYL
jgi:hypothetical protein